MSSRRVVASIWFTSARRRGAMRVRWDWLRSRHRPPPARRLDAPTRPERARARSETRFASLSACPRNGAMQPYRSEAQGVFIMLILRYFMGAVFTLRSKDCALQYWSWRVISAGHERTMENEHEDDSEIRARQVCAWPGAGRRPRTEHRRRVVDGGHCFVRPAMHPALRHVRRANGSVLLSASLRILRTERVRATGLFPRCDEVRRHRDLRVRKAWRRADVAAAVAGRGRNDRGFRRCATRATLADDARRNTITLPAPSTHSPGVGGGDCDPG